MELEEKLLSSKNPSEHLLEEGGSFYQLIEKLHQNSVLSEEVIMPLIEIGQVCGFNFYKITQPLLKSLVLSLEKSIEEYPSQIPQILEAIHPYLNCIPFYSLFEKIVLNMQSLPDYFLLELIELPSKQFLEIFPNMQSKSIIFHKCKPIFHRLLFQTINDFASDYSILDQFLVSIKLVIPRKPAIEDFSQEFNYYFNLVNSKSRASSLKDLHNEICDTAKNTLLNLCCESDDLYQEICCILRDLWEKTSNPLYAALRLEISYENLPWRSDPILQLSRWIISFLDNFSIISKESPPPVDSKDAIFVLNDPHFQYLLYCVFLKAIVVRVSKVDYVPFNKRDESRNIIQFFFPQATSTQIEIFEDFANFIEAYYVSIAIYEDSTSDESETIRSYLSEIILKDDKLCNLVLFCGQQMIQRRKDQSLLDLIVDVIQKQNENGDEEENKTKNGFLDSPNLIIAHVMMTHLSYSGLAEIGSGMNDSVEKRMNILFSWSKINRSIRVYFISLLVKRSKDVLGQAIAYKNDQSRQKEEEEKPPFYMKEYDIIKEWLNRVFDEIDNLDLIENAMLESANSNLETVLI